MKTLFSGLFIFGFLSLSIAQQWVSKMDNTTNIYEAKQEFDNYWNGKTVTKGKGYKQFQRWFNFWEPRLFPSGDFSTVRHEEGFRDHQVNLQNANNGNTRAATDLWSSIGPNNPNGDGYYGIGRINFLTFDPTNSNNMFFGCPGGGLWKSSNGGGSWTPMTDYLPNLGASDLAINPNNTNIMYLATGDRDGRDTYSYGLMKTTDGGANWTTTALTASVSTQITTNRVLIDPTNENHIIVATSVGIYNSTNAGATFAQHVTNEHFIAMEFHPTNPSIIYAATYDYWGQEAKLYRSTNSGNSWSQITSGLPTTDATRIAIATTPANANYVYLLISDSDAGLKGVYRSTNSGANFSLMANTPNVLESGDGSGTGGQGWYDLAIAVSPSNANEVYVGGINVWKSTNGGSSFSKMTHWWNNGEEVIHADQHWFVFNGSEFWVCNDGGLFMSSNGGNNFTEITAGTAITQFYRLGNSQLSNDRLIAGAQDNGTRIMDGTTWTPVTGGDGMECLMDHTNPNVAFSSIQYGEIRKTTNGGGSFYDVSPDPGNGAWITPFVMDPNNNQIMYAGYNDIYKSTDNGENWSLITSGLSGDLLRFMTVAKSNSNHVLAATYDVLYRSTNGGTNWTDITGSLPVGSASISSLTFDPADENRIWVTFSGYSNGNKVFYSNNGGASWSNFTGILPNLPVNAIYYQEGSNDVIYVGTDVGVYYYTATSGAWQVYGVDLPNVIVSDLEIQYNQGVLRAATYGRGAWEIPAETVGTPTANFTANPTSICANSFVNFTNTSINASTYEWTFSGGTPATSTDVDPTVQYLIPGTYDVKLKAINAEGADSVTIVGQVTVVAPGFETQNLGMASNAYTNFGNNNHSIAIDNDLNAVVFIHRQNTNQHGGTSGTLRYDYSFDDGQTWTLDQGPLNSSATAGVNDGRYPQIAIHNPIGNTNPTAAEVLYYAPTVDATWNGYVSGNGNLGSAVTTENYNQATGTNTLIPAALSKGANGEFWTVDPVYDGTDYSAVRIMKGTWNGSNVVWNVNTTLTPSFNTTANGTPSLAAWSIAFDPTGQNGWMVMLSHLNGSIASYQNHPVFYRTTNGGASWTGPIEVDLNSFASITSNISLGDPTTEFQVDLTVDENGNPHALFVVGSGPGTGYTIYSTEWKGMCHLHNDGATWTADIVDNHNAFSGTLGGGGNYYTNPQITRNDAGGIIALTWTDTDPALNGGTIEHDIPQMRVVGYNVASDFHSPMEVWDICSLEPGKMILPRVAERLLETSEGYEVAAVISQINASGSELDETGHLFFSRVIPNVCSANASISSATTACENETVTITDNSTNTGGYTYEWDIDNNGSIDYTTNGDINHSFATAGLHEVVLSLEGAGGCISSSIVTINVTEGPDLDVTHPASICEGTSITFTDNSTVTGPANYMWDFNGDMITDATTAGTQNYSPTGTGSVNGTLTVTDANSCTANYALNYSIDVMPTAAFTLPTTGCVNSAIPMNNNSTGGTNYEWDIDNNGSVDYTTSGNLNHTYTTAGVYTVSLDLINGGCTDNHTSVITISDAPTAAFTTLYQGAMEYDFIDNSTGNPTSYLWNFGDGNSDPTFGNVSHTYASNGPFTATLTVTNNCGNDVATEIIDFTSITENSDEEWLQIYPNPTTGILYIGIQNVDNSYYEVYNAVGKQIRRNDIHTKTTQVDLNNVAKGVYFIHVVNGSNSVKKKVVVAE